MRCLWDTNVVSEYLKGRNPVIRQRSAAYLSQFGQAHLSLISRYEVLRGLKARQATTQLAAFEAFCQNQIILSIDETMISLAADIWAGLCQRGQLIGDNDILIAATALHHGLAVATGNVAQRTSAASPG